MKHILTFLFFGLLLTRFSVSAQTIKNDFAGISFKYDEAKGISHEKGCTRRDPSDVIKVGDTHYVYYTKIYGRSPGYWGTLWYATSKDEGYTWKERGEILGLGKEGKFDSQATFTPNILYAEGKYWLYYTGVKPTPGNENGEFENNSTTDITALGLAVSDAPDGPFVRVSEEPILKVSPEPEKFDSYRVDDASLLYRNGLYWLYYKGRSRSHGPGGPAHTRMGVAFSNSPAGPFTKLDRPILAGSHEVMIWPHGTGVAAMASISGTFEYAADGVDFTSDKLAAKAEKRPHAPGAYRPDLTNPVVVGEGLKWGIGMVHNGPEAYLIRYELIK
ncbi:MAG: family 43 glycosylhydrolase [Cytophagales bacterium]|nr:family 43 glycosylhydrolase [Cytophagales bacterium]